MRRRKREHIAERLAVTGLALLAGGCGGGAGPPTVALLPAGDAPFDQRLVAAAQAEAKTLAVRLLAMTGTGTTPASQAEVVRALVARKVEAIVIDPIDPIALIVPLQGASSAGIAVVTVDGALGSTDGDYTRGDVTFPIAHVGSDNAGGGALACDTLAGAIAADQRAQVTMTAGGARTSSAVGSIYIQSVARAAPASEARVAGCETLLQTSYPNLEVVGVDYNGRSSVTAARQTEARICGATTCTSTLARVYHQAPSGIFATTVEGALGAAAAIATATTAFPGSAVVTEVAGFDPPSGVLTRIARHAMAGAIVQAPGTMGRLAVDAAVAAVRGHAPSARRIVVPLTVVDAHNASAPATAALLY